MSYTFVWVVLWLNLGGAQLQPELQPVMAMNESCDDQDFRAAAYHAALSMSDHAANVVRSDIWCDELKAPTVRQPRGSI